MSRCLCCDSPEDCYKGCDCAKYLNPEGYGYWKENHPDEYRASQQRQKNPTYREKMREAIAEARNILNEHRFLRDKANAKKP